MSCDECKTTLEIDNIAPNCSNGKGCLLPKLTDAGQRAMEQRQKIAKLSRVVTPLEAVKLIGATIEDIELIALIEEELEKNQPEGTR